MAPAKIGLSHNTIIMIKIIRAFLIIFLVYFFVACSKESEVDGSPATTNGTYTISGSEILLNGNPVQLKGVNAMNTFSIGDHDLMDEWQIEIVREFIGNLREQPISEAAVLGADNKWIHPLKEIVNTNRAHNKITVLCPFAWIEENGNRILFTGLNPSEQYFYTDYKQKMLEIAEHFKGQQDVWIETWNEPYHWNNENNYSHDLWLSNQIDMVDNLRSVEGFNNIILVPGNEQGQSENAILAKGEELLLNRFNIVFDLHAYEKWLNNSSISEIKQRIETINNHKYAILFGEIGVINAGELMQPSNFLIAANETDTSVLGWLWNRNSNDQNALLSDGGLANNLNNNNWGLKYRAFLRQ